MGQKKLQRFEEIKSFPNVLQYPSGMQGQWGNFFKNKHPLILELACGKGEYATGLGALYPEKNFIGIDLKGNRIWVGAKKALQENLQNVAFLRTQIDKINEYFATGEVDDIWITFPDPQLRTGKAKKRLTHPKFLRLYKEFLKPGGLIHLKTDSPALYEFTKLVIGHFGCILQTDIDNLYSHDDVPRELTIKTHYETLDIAGTNRIHYLKFTLPAEFPSAAKDKEFQKFLKEYEPATD